MRLVGLYAEILVLEEWFERAEVGAFRARTGQNLVPDWRGIERRHNHSS